MTRRLHIIAEAGTNHNGRRDVAERLVDVALAAGADSVKFQIIYPDGLYLPRAFQNGRYTDNEVFGKRLSTMLRDDDYHALAGYCKRIGIEFGASVFDRRGIDLLDQLDASYVKIASCDLNNSRLLIEAAERKRRLVISTGMASLEEIERAVSDVVATGNRDLILMHCVSVYPCPTERMNLSFLGVLQHAFGFPVGLSDHTENSLAAAMAIGMGAEWIEKHFTLDRKAEGFDHAYAMEPADFGRFVRDMRSATEACRTQNVKVQSAEVSVKARARRGVYAAHDIEEGGVLRETDVIVVRPEGPLRPNDLPLILGKVATRKIVQYEPLSLDLFHEPVPLAGHSLPISSVTERSLKVLFICSGSVQHGIGHVMRSRTVARAMRPSASVKMVVIGDAYVSDLLADSELDYVIATREDEVMPVFHEHTPDVAIFDLMHYGEANFQDIRQSTMTVSLSPIFNCLLAVDVVFHRTAIRGENWPVGGTKPLVRSGLEYAVVGEHCHRIPEEAYRQNLERETLSIAVSMGGTDAANKTLQVVRTMKQIPERLLVWVLLGEGYAHSYQDLVEAMRGSQHEIILAKTNDSMWRILSTCSLAVLAGGTTTYEAAYAGLPSINTLETDQHLFLIQELVERGLCLCVGRTFAESLRALNEVISHLNRNRQELAAMHLRSKGAIDGLGVQRIVGEIERFHRAYCSERSRHHGPS